jgi:CHAT domain-containing protein
VAFVLRKDRPLRLLDLGPAAPLAAAVDAWRQSFGRGEAGGRAAQLLRERVWLPIEAELAGAKLVLVSPDGVLGRLPFGALPGGRPGTFLLEEQAFVTVPVPQMLPDILAETPAPSGGSLLLVGDVNYERLPEPNAAGPRSTERTAIPGWKQFDPLGGTAWEMASLAKTYRDQFGPHGLTTLARSDAREERFAAEAPRHDQLHLATHGFFAPPELRSALAWHGSAEPYAASSGDGTPQLVGHQPGLLSGLALAGANAPAKMGADGILTATEVQTLDLRKVHLATLSACETGLGEAAGGEGILGLQRAFQLAGARTTVASLWMVDDAQTQALMDRFYSNLWNGKMSRLAALREAQLWMLRHGRPSRDREGQRGAIRVAPSTRADEPLSPFYWAAFVLSGDWR